MNKIETAVYNLVRKNPALKQTIRNLYQGVFDLMPRKSEILPEGYDYREGYFFGFHDVSPLSADETKLLAMHNSFDFRMPRPEEGLEVGYFDFNNGKIGEWHRLGISYAWNFHKGCRLQWLDNGRVIFNTAVDGKLCAQIIDIPSRNEKTIPYPIDSVYVSEKEAVATSFSYERLERCMPGYGYPYKDGGDTDKTAPDDTGLFLIDLNLGTRRKLLNLHDLAMQVCGCVEDEYLHFVTHTEFSPDGRYISFLYRRIPKEGDYMKRRSVMCVYDRHTEKLIVLPTQESGSHYVWNSRNKLVASVNLDGKNCHALFSPEDLSLVQPVDAEHLNSDGHQSFVNDDCFITDTYPDKYRMANIYLVDIDGNNSRLMAKVYSPKKFQTKDFHCHIACDLHPRVIGNGKWVCFDSPRTGKRGLYVIPLTY
ncbi:MAG: hypothetical protein HDS68_10395 [Bacteroidales bacterium]|nr:hypothetical protein [Bacteroidales bacterium]